MARLRAGSHYVCQSCAASFPRWEGQCRSCGAWNSLVETVAAPTRRRPVPGDGAQRLIGTGEPRALAGLAARAVVRIPVGIGEFDRVLGGGLVPGSLLLLAGEPGIGKSTLVLQLAAGVAASVTPGVVAGETAEAAATATGAAGAGSLAVLYASGEESSSQLHLRAVRLGLVEGPAGRGLHVLDSADVDAIIEVAARVRPRLLVVDSIQMLTAGGLEGPAGSVGQVRESAARLGALARSSGTTVLLVGHVTKDGSLAGPRALEHLVDGVLLLEGDRTGSLRVLRGLKNRHGSTDEVGLLEMSGGGLRELHDPAHAFLRDAHREAPGLAVAAILEGSRPLLVEVEALVAPTGFGPPRRTAAGIDTNRLLLLVAVLGRRGGVDLSGRDVYVSLAGGVSVEEPALDLPLVLAMASSARDRPLPSSTLSCGEVSLLGEVRPIRGLERRLREAARLGFRRAIVPWDGQAEGKRARIARSLEVVPVRSLREALEAAIEAIGGTSG